MCLLIYVLYMQPELLLLSVCLCVLYLSGNSFFNWGLSIGMMYMMSTGKAEIIRLNNSMDETAKLVQELKAELSRRKSLHIQYGSNFRTEVNLNQNNLMGKHAHATVIKSFSEKAEAFKVFGPLIAEEGECASSVLTEEQQPDLLEMDQLEAEFECELQKLPWSSTEGSGLNEKADTSQVIVFFYLCTISSGIICSESTPVHCPQDNHRSPHHGPSCSHFEALVYLNQVISLLFMIPKFMNRNLCRDFYSDFPYVVSSS